MDGLFNLCGSRETEFRHEGRTYTFAVRTLAGFAQLESFILSQSVNPYVGMDTLPEAMQHAAIALAVKEASRPRIVSVQDEMAFSASWSGLGYRVWKGLCTHHPDEFPPDLPSELGTQLGLDFIEWAGDERGEELRQILDKTNEDDILKNSSGPREMAVA